jgi:hypothetical protein
MWEPRRLTTLKSSTACYEDIFPFLYVDDVRTSHETPWTTIACYGDRFTVSYVDDVRTSQETHYGPPRSVTD